MKESVHIFGVAGYNLGDDAIAVASVEALEELMPEYSFRVANMASPGSLTSRYGIEELAVNRRTPSGTLRMMRHIVAAHHVVVGGGGLIQDQLGLSALRGILAYMLQIAIICKAFGKKIESLPIGVDELQTPRGKRYARRVLSAIDNVVVRDKKSFELALEYVGNSQHRVQEWADPAFLFESKPRQPIQPVRFNNYVVLSLVRERTDFSRTTSMLQPALKRMVEVSGLDGIVLLPMDLRHEDELSGFEEWLARDSWLAANAQLLVPHCAAEALQVLRQARMVVAMRLHAMIFSLGHVPIYGLSRTTKTDTFLRENQIIGAKISEPLHPEVVGDELLSVLYDHARVEQQLTRRKELIDLAGRALSELAHRIQHRPVT